MQLRLWRGPAVSGQTRRRLRSRPGQPFCWRDPTWRDAVASSLHRQPDPKRSRSIVVPNSLPRLALRVASIRSREDSSLEPQGSRHGVRERDGDTLFESNNDNKRDSGRSITGWQGSRSTPKIFSRWIATFVNYCAPYHSIGIPLGNTRKIIEVQELAFLKVF